MEWQIGPLGSVNTIFHDSIHYGLSDDIDWEALVPHGGVIHLGPERQQYSIALFHQLRCLDILRKAKPEHASEDPLIVHCINYLRQMMHCHMDMHLDSIVGPGTPIYVMETRTCRDWATVYAEVERNHKSSDPSM